jgi:quercetin dioxygenase-like cupin family protein
VYDGFFHREARNRPLSPDAAWDIFEGVKVERWNRGKQGPVSEAKLRNRLETEGYSVVRQTYVPGTRFEPHTHQTDKVDAVISGRLRVVIAGETVMLGPGDLIRVPRGWEHSAEVDGDRPVVSLDGVKISI